MQEWLDKGSVTLARLILLEVLFFLIRGKSEEPRIHVNCGIVGQRCGKLHTQLQAGGLTVMGSNYP